MLDSENRVFQKFILGKTPQSSEILGLQTVQGCPYKSPQEPNNCGFHDDSHPL